MSVELKHGRGAARIIELRYCTSLSSGNVRPGAVLAMLTSVTCFGNMYSIAFNELCWSSCQLELEAGVRYT